MGPVKQRTKAYYKRKRQLNGNRYTNSCSNKEIENQQQQQVNVISSELGQSKTNKNSTAYSAKIIPIVTETILGNLNDSENSISGYRLLDYLVW